MLRRALSGLIFYSLFGVLIAHSSQFLEAPQYATGKNPQAVAVGDFNGDGKPDLAVVNATADTVSILLGNGDGTFQAKVDYATGNAPQGVAVGDFNGDGKLDLAITDSASSTVSVFFGNGNGTFQTKVDYATGKKPQGIAVGDFDADGHMDLVVTNATDGAVGVLLNKGNGTFNTQAAYNTGFNPYSVVVGDFNGDGVQDLAVANNNNNNLVSVLLGNGNGTFQTQFQYPTGNTPFSIAAGDVNGDGKLDIVVANQQGDSVSVLLGNGNGAFQNNVEYRTAAFPTSVALGDFNGDGHLDIAVATGNGNTLSVLMGNGDGTFQTQINYGTGDIPYAVIAADLNDDKKIDLVVTDSGASSVSVLVGNGDGTFQSRVDYAAGTNPNSVATGDFNGDGNLDLAIATSNCPSYPACGAGTVSIVLGNGDGAFQAPSHFSTGTATDPYSVAVGDFNGDKILDLAVVNYATNTVSVMLGVGDGTFPTHLDYPVGSEPTSVVIGDLNGDGKLDMVVSNFHSNTVSVLLGNGDGTFKPAVSYTTGNGPTSVALADFNGDRRLDLVVVNETDNDVSVLLGSGDGTFKSAATYPTGVGGNPLSVAVGDFNGDHNIDLAVADFQTQEVSVLLGNGDGTFQTVKAYPSAANPSSVVMADFNGDGKMDLAMTSTPLGSSPGNLVSLLLGNGDGSFGAPTVFGTGSQAYSAAVGDFNGDGAPDLAVANGISNTASVLINSQGTKMIITPSANPSLYRQTVTFATTVSASVTGVPAPTGTVSLKNGSTVLGSGTLVGGLLSISTSNLPTGNDSVTAVYSGDSRFQPHTVVLTQTVQMAGSTTLLISSANPSGEGQSVTLTATVSSTTTGTPTGTVTFLDGATTIGSSALNGSGVATLSTSALSMGTHSITAAYGGDTNFNVSTSPVLNQVVQKESTTTALTSGSSSGNLTLTATVTPGTAGVPTGAVNFMDGTTQLGNSTLNGSELATLSISKLSEGAHSISAAYVGDGNFNASTSSAISVTADFTLAASVFSPSSVTPGQSATSSITITPSNGFDPAGVTFTCSIAPAVSPAATCSVGNVSTANDTATATVSTVGARAALSPTEGTRSSGILLALGLLIPALLLGTSGRGGHQHKKLLSLGVMFLLLGVCVFQPACGGGGGISSSGSNPTGTPAGAYTVTVTGTANGVQHTAVASLTVK
jgi:hypothetical protein